MTHRVTSDALRGGKTGLTVAGIFAYAAPALGSDFFYIPMWSILPGIYGKYFGLPLTVIAASILIVRIFDGIVDTTVGYLSDRHRLAGGSRKWWIAVGGPATVVACYFLFVPPIPVTPGYYLTWSLIYFLAFTIIAIPHLTWGSELTLEYRERVKVYSIRNIVSRVGMMIFYALPLLPRYQSTEYTPLVLHDAVYVGGVLMAIGGTWAVLGAPNGIRIRTSQEDSFALFVKCFIRNTPLLIYMGAFAASALCYGMWFGLVYLYLDTYLGLGHQVAVIFIVGFGVAAITTPIWLWLVQMLGKSVTWAIGLAMFILQLAAMWLVTPSSPWWLPLTLTIVANLAFSCHDSVALSILGDVIDYAKLKFRKDRSTTYFALNTLIYKIGLGVGGGTSLAIAGMLGFSPSASTHSTLSIVGLKLGFLGGPAIFAGMAILFILRTPVDERRQTIIRRRIAVRAEQTNTSTGSCEKRPVGEGNAHASY